MHVFTYGTLMYPAVLESLIHTQPEFENITLIGYERRGIVGEIYPGIFQKAGSFVTGRLWFDLSNKSIRILDQFEGSMYVHKIIEIESVSRGMLQARVYVIPEENKDQLLREDWDMNCFEEKHLKDYVEMCRQVIF